MGDYTKETIETYNKTVGEYAKNVAGLHHVREGEIFLSCLPSGGRILDLGCGSGRDALEFVGQGYNVVGADLSEKMLEQARKTCPYADFQKMDMRQLGYSDESFDGVWAVASIIHLPKSDVPSCLGEIYRVLKRNGVFYVCVKQGEGEGFEPDLRYGPNYGKFYSYFQPEELNKMLGNSGFDVLGTAIYDWKDVAYLQRPEIRIFAKKPEATFP